MSGAYCVPEGLCWWKSIFEHTVGAQKVQHSVKETNGTRNGAAHALSFMLPKFSGSWCFIHESVLVLECECFRTRDCVHFAFNPVSSLGLWPRTCLTHQSVAAWVSWDSLGLAEVGDAGESSVRKREAVQEAGSVQAKQGGPWRLRDGHTHSSSVLHRTGLCASMPAVCQHAHMAMWP